MGSDVVDVTEGLGYDRSIGQAFLSPGPGWGGSCLPKDTHALLQAAGSVDFEFRLLRAAIDTNTRQYQRMVDKIRTAVTGRRNSSLSRRRLLLLGLTFKAGIDDLRDSPALAVVALLRQAGAQLVGYDPGVGAGSTTIAGSLLTVVDDPYEAAQGVEAIVVLTEWTQFRSLDWRRLAEVAGTALVVDTRNLLDPDVVARAGFIYAGIGRRVRARREA